MIKYKSVIFITLLSFFQSCGAQNKKDAIRLNNEAMSLVMQDEGNIQRALQMLDQAIALDSLYYMAYTNKASLLCRVGSYEEAINALNKVLAIKRDFVEAAMTKGFLLEKLGKVKQAEETYSHVFELYNKQLKKSPDNIQILLNRAFTTLFLYGNQRGLLEYNKIKTLYPNNATVIGMQELFNTFNRKEYLLTVCN